MFRKSMLATLAAALPLAALASSHREAPNITRFPTRSLLEPDS